MIGYVYFMKAVGQAGPIKIGHSTFPPARLAVYQTWNPVDLEIVSQFSGPLSLEKAIHERFARWHIRGEWFEAVDELVSLMEGIRDGRKLEDLVDLSIKTGKLAHRPKAASPKAKIVGSFKRRVDRARQYASRMSGGPIDESVHVRKILSTAGGYRQEYRDLTSDEVNILEAFISDCRDREKYLATKSSPAQLDGGPR